MLDGYVYEDVDDYSPVVSDIEDGNDDETASNKTKKPHKDDTFNLIDQILNENSLHKDEEDDGNMTGPDEETESSEYHTNGFIKYQNNSLLTLICSQRKRAKFRRFDGKKENR